MKRLKIGILGTRGIPNHYGGFEQFAQYLSLGLVERGHEVYVYNSDRHPYREKEWNGVQIIHCRDLEYKYGTFGQFFYDLNCNKDAAKREFDILLHLGYTSDSIWYWRWPKKGTINMVNMDGMEWKRSKYNKPTQRFLRWAESLAAKNAEVLVADSPRIQEYLYETYGKKAVFIPYGAEVFTGIDATVPAKHNLEPYKYSLLVARMEPENNIEMIIKGYLASQQSNPLMIIGNINKFGAYLKDTYRHPDILFSDPVYDQPELSNLRYHSAKYFHGHSVGGTNPSLLEAMACGCNIAAHNNVFNKAVLADEADYFSSAEEIAAIINNAPHPSVIAQRKEINISKINSIYNLEKNISDYERLMLNSCGESTVILKAAVKAETA